MLKKQDRQGVRTAADLERKYDFGKIVKIAKNAQNGGGDGTTTGYVSFEVDDAGNLYVCTSGDGNPPVLEYDEATGNLYYVTEGV